MTKERIILGKIGEDLARQRLKDLGYRIIKANYTCALGEIDLIARDGDVLVFVEIKTRKKQSLGFAKEAVTKRKQVKLSKVALAYMKYNNLLGSKARFDVVAVGVSEGKKEIEIVKDAFELAY
ncbi:MAG: YraN family protein [Deltaproteobacteria bacterium]|jgi:putative endonuclease|nr:MAG: YraN family protein [Deltaproteobacteria bacterium]